MLFKKAVVFALMAGYLYTVAFNIFMTSIFRIPAPMIFGLLLLPFIQRPLPPFIYLRECILFTLALFLYHIVGMSDYTGFFLSFVTIIACALYFNYFVGTNKLRFNISVAMLFAWLAFSMIIMVFDHTHPDLIDAIRSRLLDEQIKQSPAGLAITQFTFGYQIAAFTTLAFIATFTFRLNALTKVLVFCACMLFLYLGMNRSALISFAGAVMVFLFIQYRLKAVILVAIVAIISILIYNYVLKDNFDSKNNILAKNEAKEANDFNRANMAAENLKIVADYPFGLIFYGKDWDEVTYRNSLFTFGLSSHNAYLMFITYLGPFLGIGLLVAIYYRITRLFAEVVKHIKLKHNAILVALIFAFLATSLNALSHNGWLIDADGPTLFLYLAVLHSARLTSPEPLPEPVDELSLVEA
ncbi:MAG: O-antigen ligase family protein [Mucilaginibacter sp.]|uniref:O-antigen ligase family protein n=1 Tax=Mucilaginibacter sp. TaxID=1882438 RepID=UPI0031B0FD50